MFHSYLLLTNQTTNEVYHKAKILYLNRFKDLKIKQMENANKKVKGSMPFHPFDSGCKENIKIILFKKEEINWLKIYKENLLSSKIPFNFCENEYWSCI